MKNYEFSKEYKVLIALFLLVLTLYSIPPYDDYKHAAIPFFCIYIWYQVLTIPYKVTVAESRLLIFKSLFKTTFIKPSEIIKIEDSIFSYKILLNTGSLRISTLMNNAYGLKRAIETQNSVIETEDIHLKNIENLEKRNPLIMFGFILAFLIFSIILKFCLFTL